MTDSFSEPAIILITGIMASGKSTVAQALAERFPKSVHVRGDVFRRMIVSGRAEMESPPSDEAWQQLRLRYRLAAQTALTYRDAGFMVVMQDVMIGGVLPEVVEMLRAAPLYVVVLCPTVEAVARREAEREKTGYGAWTPEMLDHSLRQETPHIGLWLDTSNLSVSESVDVLLAQLDAARIDGESGGAA